MGVTQCSIHGLAGIAQTCRHLGEAMDAATMEPSYVARDEFGVEVLLCSRCADRYGLKINRMLEDDGPDAVCVQCLKDWRLRTGQGDLLSRFEK